MPDYTDAVLSRCSTDHRQQNEPSLAIDPANRQYVAAGANDYCTIPNTQDAWQGIYRSTDGGSTFQLGLIPGYPGDTSAAGKASPLSGLVTATGDPWNAWDGRGGYLYAMGNGFNRSAPQNGSVWVATFDQLGQHYVRTVLLAKGVPAVNGPFNDKVGMAVDNSTGSNQGNVYAAWSQFQGARGNNEIDVAVSRDHGATFSRPVKVSQAVANSQFADVTVTPDGTAYVVWRAFAGRNQTADAAVYTRSTDGGRTWSAPKTISTFTPYDKSDTYGSPSAAAAANKNSPDSVDGADGASAGARDCGDGALACTSGYTFYRDDSQTRIASDAHGVYVVWNQLQNPHPTGSSYSPGGYSRVVISRFNGTRWSSPAVVDQSGAVGHQTFPTVASDGTTVTVGWNDSRNDSCFSQERPAGNCADRTAPTGGSLDTYVRQLSSVTLAPVTNSAQRISSGSQNPNYEQYGGRLVPFFGDYITVATGDGSTLIDWTDNRNVVPASTTPDGNDVAGDPAAGGACTSVFTDCFDTTKGEDQDVFISSLGS